MRKAEDMHDRILAHLSLSGAIQASSIINLERQMSHCTFRYQPTSISSVENCQFAEYAHSSDMYKAKIVLADRSSLIVRMSMVFLSSDVLTNIQVVAKAHRFLPNDREQLTNVSSCRHMLPATLISFTDGQRT